MNSTKKEILYLLHLPPPLHGSSIVGELVKESKLLRHSFRGRYINLILSRKVNESGKTSLKKMIRFVIIGFNLLGKLLYRKPDLCYYALTTTGSGFYKDVLLIAMIRLFRVRIIYHIHNRGIARVSKKKLHPLLYRFVFRNTCVVLLSKRLYDDVEAYVPGNQVYYCPNGIKDYVPSAASLPLPAQRPFNILFFSNLMKEKGIFVLVDACVILKHKGYSFQCDFVGGEGDVSEKQFNAYVREKGLSEQVRYLGRRYGRLKEISFEQADIFVLPSHCDCFPLVILEAMQHNLPVISTYEGGIPDMVDVENTGFLLPSHDVEALSEKIAFLHANPELGKQMGINGRTKYEKNFTLPLFEQRLLNILQEVLHK